MKPGDVVHIDGLEGTVTQVDSEGRLKVEIWAWPLELDDWWEENAK